LEKPDDVVKKHTPDEKESPQDGTDSNIIKKDGLDRTSKMEEADKKVSAGLEKTHAKQSIEQGVKDEHIREREAEENQ